MDYIEITHAQALQIMEDLSAAGLSFTLTCWQTTNGVNRYQFKAAPFLGPAEQAIRAIEIAKKHGLRAWFGSEGVSFETPTRIRRDEE